MNERLEATQVCQGPDNWIDFLNLAITFEYVIHVDPNIAEAKTLDSSAVDAVHRLSVKPRLEFLDTFPGNNRICLVISPQDQS